MNGSSLLVQMNEVNLGIFKVLAARYKKMGLEVTPVQSRVIMFIYNSEKSICQKEIEGFLSCSKSTVSALIDTMEKKNLIKREDSLTDLRKKHLFLTDKAIKIALILKQDKEEMEKILCENISSDEYNLFSDVLLKIKSNLERI